MMRLALMFMVVLCTSCGGKPETGWQIYGPDKQ